MNKILLHVDENSPMIEVAEGFCKKYNRTFARQDYQKAFNLIHRYDYPLFDQLISDGPGYELQDSFKENIYANYDVVVVHYLTLNIIAEAIVNDFNVFATDPSLDSYYRSRGTFAFARQNFKNYYTIDRYDPGMLGTTAMGGKHTETLWSRKND